MGRDKHSPEVYSLLEKSAERYGNPKPKKREKKERKGLKRRAPGRRRKYTTEQRERRREKEVQYAQFDRPGYLLTLARRQGRLKRSNVNIAGDTPREKLDWLDPNEYPLCEFALEETGCRGNNVATEVHHDERRDGNKLNDPSTYTGGCHPCHQYVEEHPKWAREQGYIKTRHVKVTTSEDYGR